MEPFSIFITHPFRSTKVFFQQLFVWYGANSPCTLGLYNCTAGSSDLFIGLALRASKMLLLYTVSVCRAIVPIIITAAFLYIDIRQHSTSIAFLLPVKIISLERFARAMLNM